jgi:hypothetical protein
MLASKPPAIPTAVVENTELLIEVADLVADNSKLLVVLKVTEDVDAGVKALVKLEADEEVPIGVATQEEALETLLT